MKYSFTLILIFLSFSWGFSQQNILDDYVSIGLKNNLALQQQKFSLQQSVQALNQARGMFLPSVSIEARYSRAGGGRMIDFPIGDLMNPVYNTLNQLLAAIGQQPGFPTNLPNEHIPFLREEEQETKIRVIQPIFTPAIYFNYKIKSSLAHVQRAAISIFRRQLSADIKTAYFNHLKAVQVIELLDKTRLLLEENLRVSESLFTNDKATEDVVFRAKAEISAFEQKYAEAEKNIKLSAAYFNFLINRPLDAPIKILPEAGLSFYHEINLEDAWSQAMQQREEFPQLRGAISAAKGGMSLSKSSFLPGLTGVLDYGYQGEKYRFTEKDDYWMASLILQWNLFNGFQDRAKFKQAALEKSRIESQLMELKNRIKLQVQSAVEELGVARKSINAARERLNSVRQSFNIVDKKYRQGMAPHIEYLDARTTFTNAGINLILDKYDYQIKFVEFENAIGNR